VSDVPPKSPTKRRSAPASTPPVAAKVAAPKVDATPAVKPVAAKVETLPEAVKAPEVVKTVAEKVVAKAATMPPVPAAVAAPKAAAPVAAAPVDKITPAVVVAAVPSPVKSEPAPVVKAPAPVEAKAPVAKVAKPKAVATPITRAPAIKAPIAQAPIAQAPVAKPPVAKPPIAKPAVSAPVATPVAKAENSATAFEVAVVSESKGTSNETTPDAKTGEAQQGRTIMATTVESFIKNPTDRAQAMFGDINERSKAAMEKSAKLIEEMSELTKGNVEALVASGKAAAKGAETLGADAVEYSKRNFEKASGAMKSFASVKSPTELFQLQSEYAKSSFDSAVAEASKFSEAYLKLMGDVFAPISNRIAIASDKIKSATTL